MRSKTETRPKHSWPTHSPPDAFPSHFNSFRLLLKQIAPAIRIKSGTIYLLSDNEYERDRSLKENLEDALKNSTE